MKQSLLTAALLFCFVASKAQTGFYDVNTIQEINITFNQSNWDYMMDTAAIGAEGYVLAAQVSINGTVFDSVGVKYKGNSSYNANNAKNPTEPLSNRWSRFPAAAVSAGGSRRNVKRVYDCLLLLGAQVTLRSAPPGGSGLAAGLRLSALAGSRERRCTQYGKY